MPALGRASSHLVTSPYLLSCSCVTRADKRLLRAWPPGKPGSLGSPNHVASSRKMSIETEYHLRLRAHKNAKCARPESSHTRPKQKLPREKQTRLLIGGKYPCPADAVRFTRDAAPSVPPQALLHRAHTVLVCPEPPIKPRTQFRPRQNQFRPRNPRSSP